MNPALENLEIAILLEAVFRHSGYDFRNYVPASIKRRIQECVRVEKVETISDLQARVLHDPNCLERFLLALSINVTAMFRDPAFYLAFRTRVVPLLRTYPSLRIWVAGCATGEEACSLAILLQEEGLYERCKIYATDLNAAMLKKATEPNKVGSGMELYKDAALPASQLPMLVERNQMPMMKPAARGGASLVMALSPTGLRHNSPSVWSR